MHQTAALFLLLFLTVSCGESPLWNHRIEGKNFLTNPQLAESEAVSFKKAKFSFALSWQEGPQMGASRFLIRAWNQSSGSINGPYQDFPKTLNVFLWMPAMGHGSAPVKLKRLDDGEYEVSEVQFIMGGKWEIKFQLKDGSQVFDEAVVTVTL